MTVAAAPFSGGPFSVTPTRPTETFAAAVMAGSATITADGTVTAATTTLTLTADATITIDGVIKHTFAGAALLTGNALLAAAGIDTLKIASASLFGSATLTPTPNFRIFAATREFITEPSEVLSNQPFSGTLQKALRFDRSIINGTGFGQVTAGWGTLELINIERDYDVLIRQYAVDGRRVVVKVGNYDDRYTDFMTLFDGTATGYEVTEDSLVVTLRDNSYKLEVPAQANLYTGAGGLFGGPDLTSKRKPLVYGQVKNITPVLVLATNNLYQVHDGKIQAVTAVYDRGNGLLWSGVDYATVALLRGATTGLSGSGAAIEAGEYATCSADGYFRLGGVPAGLVTADVHGDKTGNIFATSTSDIIKRLILRSTTVVTADLSLATFAAVNAAQPATVGYYIDSASNISVADVVADLMGGIVGWGGFRRRAKFELGLVTSPVGVPSAYYTRDDILTITRENLPSSVYPPPWRWRVPYDLNWTVQTSDFAGAVSPSRIAFLKETSRLATASSQTVRTDHPLAQDPAPLKSYFANQADALALANSQLALYSTTNSSMYRMKLKGQPFIHEIGELIHMTYPRWDLTSGRYLRIVEIHEDTDANEVEIVGFG